MLSIPALVYPKPLQARGSFTRSDIWNAIKRLKLNKAPGLDGIKNIVLKECVESLTNNLYYIYRAILKLNTYPTCWLMSLTIVLHKPGKPAYDVAKAYQPIGLLDTMGKLFSVMIHMDSFLSSHTYSTLTYISHTYDSLLPQTLFFLPTLTPL